MTEARNELIQPIVLLVDRDAPAAELDGILAVATASVAAYREDIANGGDLTGWDEWLSGPFAKSVRRADKKTFGKVQAAFQATHRSVGTAEALGFRPVPATAMPKTLARLQVSGTTLPVGVPSPAPAGGPGILLNSDLGMSTGKAAAQAAHALFAWYLHHQQDTSEAGVRYATRDEIEATRAAHPTAVVIEDAGRTEIEPGSLTAICF